MTGVGGQDGALLSALLLAEGYDVVGIVRRDPDAYAESLGDLRSRIEFVAANLLDRASLAAALRATRPP
ncbi:MAG TPA: GDP-mannose 4,6-dehydratase, partial [Gaiella sp.]|nr:GDP-mannose 4,6-dehydratase [Gaiella sp.]